MKTITVNAQYAVMELIIFNAYIFFLFYFLLGLDNMGFYYLIQIKIDWLIEYR